MDAQKDNTSFGSLFVDNADGVWIVTKTEKGKQKLARCTTDEIDELYKTRTDWLVKSVEENETTPETSDKVPNWQLRGTAMFFIRDLLNCQKIDYYFIFKNIPFLNVFLCGTVVSLSTHNDKYIIAVDDGTSNIKCLIKQQELAALQLNEEQKQRHIELTQAFRADPKDPVLKARAIMMRSLKSLVKNTHSFEDLQLGNIVTVMGTLSQYNDKRYIFVISIEKEPEDSLYHMTYTDELLQLYKNRFQNT